MPENPSAAVLAKTASDYKVEIIRDDWGVPHIFEIEMLMLFINLEQQLTKILSITMTKANFLPIINGAKQFWNEKNWRKVVLKLIDQSLS